MWEQAWRIRMYIGALVKQIKFSLAEKKIYGLQYVDRFSNFMRRHLINYHVFVKSPVYIGNCWNYESAQRLYIQYNMYFDQDMNTWVDANLLTVIGKYTLLFFKDYFRKEVYLYIENFYWFIWKYRVFARDPFPFGIAKGMYDEFSKLSEVAMLILIREIMAIRLLKRKWRWFRQSLRYFNRNNYFRRLLPVITSCFCWHTVECTLFTYAVAKELGDLRSYHKKFIRILTKLIRSLFKFILKPRVVRNYRVRAVEIRLKGRLTYYRRQNRRKSKKFIRCGKFRGISNPNLRFQSGLTAGTNRFGNISVRLWVLDQIIGLRQRTYSPRDTNTLFWYRYVFA